MNTITPIKKKITVDLSKYHNSETGELLTSALNENTTMNTQETTNLVTINSDDYAVIDSKALQVITGMVNNSDLANVLKMAVVTKTPLNIVYNNNVPHTNETMQTYLQVKSESMYIQLIKRLMKAGILYQIKGLIHGEVRVCYLLNPFLSRKRKTIDAELTVIFSEFKQLKSDEV